MYRSELLVPQRATGTRIRTDLRRLRISDPAMRAMTDFQREPPLTAAEDCDLDTALDNMFRLGVRAFLVVRELVVVGLITVEDIRQAYLNIEEQRALDELTKPKEVKGHEPGQPLEMPGPRPVAADSGGAAPGAPPSAPGVNAPVRNVEKVEK